MTDLTRAQRTNLKKLAVYLENLPEDYGFFGMRDFNSLEGEIAVEYALKNGGLAKFAEVNECGTVACAVGHGPSAGILFRKTKDFDTIESLDGGKFKQPDWDTYSERFAPRFSNEWDWMFGPDWDDVDDTHRGAAARIRYILDGGEPFSVDIDGECFTPTGYVDAMSLYAKYLVKGDDHIKAKAKA